MSTQAGIVQLRTRASGANGNHRHGDAAPVLFAVDDDVATVELLCEVARARGWAASGFTRLEQLTDALRGAPPTLLVLDDELPDGRGGDLARRLRSDPTTAGIPLVVCTAAHPMRQAEIGGWAPVIAKPFDLEEVERVLDSAARRHHRSGRLDEAG
jgi:DNA-binding response OmpR family regulator